MPVDAYSHHKCLFRSRMWPKHCQPNHPVEKPQSYSRTIEQKTREVTYAECQVEDYLVCVKVLVVLATVQREVCGRFAPSGVRKEHISLEQPALSYLRWDVAVSRPEPDLNAIISRSGHDVISTTIEVKCRAVGGATVRDEDTTPLVVICRSPAAVADGSSA
jgi:hypothetical protein